MRALPPLRSLTVVASLLVVGLAVAGCTDGSEEPQASATRAPATSGSGGPLYRDASQPVQDRVEDLLARMEVADKVGQMMQAERGITQASDVTEHRLGSVFSGGGSVPQENTPAGWADLNDELQKAALATPLGIPILYGADAVHGHNNVYGATVFPHNIGLGATGDPALVERIGRATALEVAATGVDWTFAPCVCVVRDDRWGRSYESFGEVPELASAMTSVITGLQGETLGAGPASVLATAKHFVGDGGTAGGTDQGDTLVSEEELRAIHLPPYKAAIERGVGSVMVSFSSWNGDKMHGNKYLVTDVLKGELGFEGFVVSDWAAVDQLDGEPNFTRAEVATAVNAGIDMLMVPEDFERSLAYLTLGIENGDIPIERVDDAVRRILTVKFRMGLFEDAMTDRSLAPVVGSDEHRALAREAVAKSLVVLKNDGVLPLAEGARVFVGGSNANNLGHQAGGWTMTWQGGSGETTVGTTILEGMQQALGADAVSSREVDVAGSYDVAVAVVGEEPYAEYEGDRPGGVRLSARDLGLLDRLEASGVPTVVVLVSGRPMHITKHLDGAEALVAAWLPGTEGAGVADVLTGAVAPTGTLPVSWPRELTDHPLNDGDGGSPLFPLGAGLTYAS